MVTSWMTRPLYLPDAHLPRTAEPEWQCRACATTWPCPTAAECLTAGRCQCGSVTQWETNGRRRWHPGPRCHTDTDAVRAQAAELSQQRAAAPHYPPSRHYPAKPGRRIRQRPPYRHTPGGPGDLQPGTWVWVRPSGLHPGWGDIHHLAMLTRPGSPKCELWLSFDGTVHDVRADRLMLSTDTIRNAARAAGVTTFREPGRGRRPLLPEWRWTTWTVAQHLDHARQGRPGRAPAVIPVQDGLFGTPA